MDTFLSFHPLGLLFELYLRRLQLIPALIVAYLKDLRLKFAKLPALLVV